MHTAGREFRRASRGAPREFLISLNTPRGNPAGLPTVIQGTPQLGYILEQSPCISSLSRTSLHRSRRMPLGTKSYDKLRDPAYGLPEAHDEPRVYRGSTRVSVGIPSDPRVPVGHSGSPWNFPLQRRVPVGHRGFRWEFPLQLQVPMGSHRSHLSPWGFPWKNAEAREM